VRSQSSRRFASEFLQSLQFPSDTLTRRCLQFESVSGGSAFKGRRRQSIYDIITRRVSLAVASAEAAEEEQNQPGSGLSPPATVGALEKVREQLTQERMARIKRLSQKLSKVGSADEAQAENETGSADFSSSAVLRLRCVVSAEVAKRVERGELAAWPPNAGVQESTRPPSAAPTAGPVAAGQKQVGVIDSGIFPGRRRSSLALQVEMFRQADTDNNGTLDFEEFASLDCHKDMSAEQVRAAFARLDTDGDNALTLDEFAKYRVRNLLRLEQYREEEEEEERKRQEEAAKVQKAADDRHSDDIIGLKPETIQRYSFAAGALHDRY